MGVVFVLAGVGVFGGLPDTWWDPKGFIVNLASGITAACFGVPLAFFVLQRLLDERTKRSETEEAIRLSLRNLLAIEEDILSIWGIGRGGQPDACISKQLIQELQDARTIATGGPGVHRSQPGGRRRGRQITAIRLQDSLRGYEDPQPAESARSDALIRLEHQRRVIADRSISIGVLPTPNFALREITRVIESAEQADLMARCRQGREEISIVAGSANAPHMPHDFDENAISGWSRALLELELEVSQRRILIAPLLAEIDRYSLLLRQPASRPT